MILQNNLIVWLRIFLPTIIISILFFSPAALAKSLDVQAYQKQIEKTEAEIEKLHGKVTEIQRENAELKELIAEKSKEVFETALANQSMWLSLYGVMALFLGGFAVCVGLGKITEIREDLDRQMTLIKAEVKIYASETTQKAISEAFDAGPNKELQDSLNDLSERIANLEANPSLLKSHGRDQREVTTKPKQSGNAFPINGGDDE